MKPGLAVIMALVLLVGCGREEILPGQRIDVRAEPDAPVAAATRVGVPGAFSSANWTHKSYNPAHAPGNATLTLPLERLWSVSVGEGNGRKHRIYGDPVVSGGRVYAMDSRARVTAVALGGQTLWTRDLTPPSDSANDASGGGLAVVGNRVYATTGFGQLVALDAGSGAPVWHQNLAAASLGAPTVVGNTVFAVSRDSRGWAVDAGNGRVQWEIVGVPGRSGIDGGAAPAVDGRLTYFPMTSGELIAVERNGTRAWTTPVVGGRAGRAYAVAFADITGDPVLTGGTVYVGNPAGRTMAIEAATGEPLWTSREGAMSAPVVVGGSVFVVSDANELVRLDARSGARVWGVQLPLYTTERRKRRKGVYAHYGPVLAGGRLIVASNDGYIRAFDPSTGALVTTTELPGGAASNPAVANGMLFVTDADGRLNAYR